MANLYLIRAAQFKEGGLLNFNQQIRFLAHNFSRKRKGIITGDCCIPRIHAVEPLKTQMGKNIKIQARCNYRHEKGSANSKDDRAKTNHYRRSCLDDTCLTH